jgi:hypothetical protein
VTIDIYSPTPHDPLSLQELALWRAIMGYRAEHGLPAIPLSNALTVTAGRHALDTRENVWPEDPGHSLLHDWSDARYHGANGSPEAMWFAPDRLGTGYDDPGYEIAAAGAANVADALEVWKDSPPHDAILTNSDTWADRTFRAIGIGVETSPGPGVFAGRIFYVWFGETADEPPPVRGTVRADAIWGTQFSDRLVALGGNDRVSAGLGRDAVSAGPGHDRVDGGYGNDTLAGGPGNDHIAGGPGRDIMSGGPGADVFVFVPGDRIVDFQPGLDRIQRAAAVDAPSAHDAPEAATDGGLADLAAPAADDFLL